MVTLEIRLTTEIRRSSEMYLLTHQSALYHHIHVHTHIFGLQKYNLVMCCLCQLIKGKVIYNGKYLCQEFFEEMLVSGYIIWVNFFKGFCLSPLYIICNILKKYKLFCTKWCFIFISVLALVPFKLTVQNIVN